MLSSLNFSPIAIISHCANPISLPIASAIESTVEASVSPVAENTSYFACLSCPGLKTVTTALIFSSSLSMQSIVTIACVSLIAGLLIVGKVKISNIMQIQMTNFLGVKSDFIFFIFLLLFLSYSHSH